MNKHVINSQLICANYEKDYPMVVKGKGIYLYDDKGNQYIDGSGATAVVTNIGHGVEEISQALKDQAETLAVYPTHVFYTPELEEYLTALCDFAPEGMNHAWTICGGTEAVENSIKLAYQYHRSKNRNRTKVLGRWGSYHGNSLTMLDIGGNKARRDYYTDLMVDQPHLSACYPYRRPEDMSIEAYEDQLIGEFEEKIKQYPEDIICFLAEPIVGAALGAVAPTENYFKRMKEICEREDILFIADEVMTGMGRTGEAFGIEHYGVTPDIMALAKGISSGYFPLGAVVAHDKVINVIRETNKPFFSGQTYSCIPLGAKIGTEVLKYHQEHKLIENSKKMGEYLMNKMEALLAIPNVGDVRGKGLFIGVEFVKDQKTKEIIEPDYMFFKKVEAKALELGLVVYGGRGTVNGTQGDHMLIAPPLIITQDQCDELYQRLEQAIQEVSDTYRAK
jgi:adenosylmethionine-8-amino-7-oxononanoate aminotransferase